MCNWFFVEERNAFEIYIIDVDAFTQVQARIGIWKGLILVSMHFLLPHKTQSISKPGRIKQICRFSLSLSLNGCGRGRRRVVFDSVQAKVEQKIQLNR